MGRGVGVSFVALLVSAMLMLPLTVVVALIVCIVMNLALLETVFLEVKPLCSSGQCSRLYDLHASYPLHLQRPYAPEYPQRRAPGRACKAKK